MKQNKKAIEINISTIVILILALLVLVLLALAFTGGLEGLWNILRGQGAIADVSTQRTICEGWGERDFCTRQAGIYNPNIKKNEQKYCWEDPINATRYTDDKGDLVPMDKTGCCNNIDYKPIITDACPVSD